MGNDGGWRTEDGGSAVTPWSIVCSHITMTMPSARPGLSNKGEGTIVHHPSYTITTITATATITATITTTTITIASTITSASACMGARSPTTTYQT